MFTQVDGLQFLQKACYIDGHADSILEVLDGKRVLTAESETGHWDFARARRIRQGAQIQVAWTDVQAHPIPAKRCLVMLDRLHEQIAADPQVALVTTGAGLREAYRAGKLGVILGIEGGEALEGDLGLLRQYYRLGVRVLGLTWNYRNALADGAQEWESEGGLTRFGRQVIQEMNRLGMVVDLAHASPKTFAQALEVSTQPVLFTHGNCRALFDHPRNLTDAQLQALAAQGGVFGISFVGHFMGKDRSAVDIGTVVEHIDHAVQVAGIKHVALGSDFDGTNWMPIGLESILGIPALVAALLNKGYKEQDVQNLLGDNYQRVLDVVLK